MIDATPDWTNSPEIIAMRPSAWDIKTRWKAAKGEKDPKIATPSIPPAFLLPSLRFRTQKDNSGTVIKACFDGTTHTIYCPKLSDPCMPSNDLIWQESHKPVQNSQSLSSPDYGCRHPDDGLSRHIKEGHHRQSGCLEMNWCDCYYKVDVPNVMVEKQTGLNYSDCINDWVRGSRQID